MKSLIFIGAGLMIGAALASAAETRRGALSGSGTDVCGDWKLAGDQLATCRRQWMDAATDADRLRLRNKYEPGADARKVEETPVTHAPESLNNPTFCDQFKLRDPDLSECRAQWKGAKTEEDLSRLRVRYEALNSKPGAARRP
jgi:hypothetical protein